MEHARLSVQREQQQSDCVMQGLDGGGTDGVTPENVCCFLSGKVKDCCFICDGFLMLFNDFSPRQVQKFLSDEPPSKRSNTATITLNTICLLYHPNRTRHLKSNCHVTHTQAFPHTFAGHLYSAFSFLQCAGFLHSSQCDGGAAVDRGERECALTVPNCIEQKDDD